MPRGKKEYSDSEYLDAILTVLFKKDALTSTDIAKRIYENGHIVGNQEFTSLQSTVNNFLSKHTSDKESNNNNLPKGRVNDIFKCDIINKKTHKWSIRSLECVISFISQDANNLNNNHKQSNEDKRNPSVITVAKELANHRCEIDPTHESFETDKGVMFTHGHHLIPWCKRNLFENSIDIVQNICALDSNCHANIHLGTWDNKVKLLKILYDKKIDGLRKVGFDISFEELLELYK